MTSLSTDGIVPATFRSADGRDAPMVQILRHNVVCEVAGRLILYNRQHMNVVNN